MKKIITSALLCLSIMSFAQQKELTLKDAIRYALENKADAEKARLEVTKSEYKIQEVRANALPNISASGGMVYNPKLQATYIDASTFAFPGMPASNEPIKMEMGQKWSANAEAKLTQVLFNQTVFMGLKAARTTREFYMLNQQLTENEIIEKVAQAYYQVYQTRQTLENIESNLALTEKTANVVKGLNQSGLSKKIDVDRTTVAVNNLKSARQQALNGVQLSENALKYMIGMPMNEVITLPKEGFEANYDLAFEKGNSNTRIELQVLEKQKQLLDLNTKVQRAALYPSLALQATYGYLSMGPKTPIIYGKKDKVYGADYSAITLGLKIPIFSGFGTRAKIRQAQIESQALEATLKDTRLAMDLAYENAHSRLTNNLLTIDSQKENVKLAEEVLLNTQNNYQQGLASLTDLLEAERSLSDAKNNYTNALLDYKLAEIQLLKSQGKLGTMK
ncbi:outer membrane efflux protein [Capnocytophaga ochracea F0287]|uniref:Outer membrane efflux protein n=1 Tax=Capnocytophaga ochracea F0287 TaxID=873517 RepID=E4MR43_CAPOC|nr:TolC family protein [Capnocytophaga ochracea]EFS97941.1 outer membrane efflux protein [Capnocytophaga ochracea F0287]EJF45796.1 outer membrane efflux protein [Capnocytophaga ochracea str. Holt 25]UEB43851.1 TolC family protein [Capnocytophaga ochracea]